MPPAFNAFFVLHLRSRHNPSSGEGWYHSQNQFICEVFWCCSAAVWTLHQSRRLPASLHRCWCASREQEQNGDYAGLPRGAWQIPPRCPTCQPEALVGAHRDLCQVLHSWGAHSSCLTEAAPAVPMECTSGAPAHVCWPHGDGHVRTRTAGGKRVPAGATSPVPWLPTAGHPSPRTGSKGQSRARLIWRCLKQEPETPMVLLG